MIVEDRSDANKAGFGKVSIVLTFIWVNSNDTFWGNILQFHLDLNKGWIKHWKVKKSYLKRTGILPNQHTSSSFQLKGPHQSSFFDNPLFSDAFDNAAAAFASSLILWYFLLISTNLLRTKNRNNPIPAMNALRSSRNMACLISHVGLISMGLSMPRSYNGCRSAPMMK